MEIIKLNLIPSGVNPTCHAKQYDKGRTIRFELFNGLTPYTLQSGDTVTLNLRKPDNTIIDTSVTATQGNKYVDLVTTEQICAVAGYNLGTFKIENGATEIGTLNFIMEVGKDVLANGIPSQSVIEDLDELVAEAVAEDLGDNYYNKTEVDAALALKLDKSAVNVSGFNKYDSSLQTPQTISPHYFVNGEPYSSTQFDNAYNCTDFIKVKPNTTYTVAIVPAYNGITKPWNEAGNGLFLYDGDKNYLGSHFETNSFTTTANTSYIRFNYFRSGGNGITLDVLNQTCMLVEGSVIPTVYEPYYTENKIDEIIKAPLQYKVGNNSIEILQGYGNKNLLIEMNKHGGNNIFDYASFNTVDKNINIEDITSNDKTLIQNITTDWHGPFQVRAVNNIDGDNLNNGNYRVYFTGGNHQYNNTGSGSTATGRTVDGSIKFYSNGKRITAGQFGFANSIRIEWINRVQGYNTTKADGSGREILEEYHVIVIDGEKFNEFVQITALEDIIFRLYYGLQFTGSKYIYTNIRYSGATNRNVYSGLIESDSGNKTPNEIIGSGTNDKITLGIDTTYDIGKRDYLTVEKGFFNSVYDKAYSYLISNDNLSISENDCIYYRGYYIFTPV